jgi:hypothetical protein
MPLFVPYSGVVADFARGRLSQQGWTRDVLCESRRREGTSQHTGRVSEQCRYDSTRTVGKRGQPAAYGHEIAVRNGLSLTMWFEVRLGRLNAAGAV